jgi:DNA primase
VSDAPAQRIGDFYVEVVLPALAERLDKAFPEFGWKRDALGWVAMDEEMTHRVLGVRAERVVAHGPAPRGFLVHGGEATLWTAYLNGGLVPHGEAFVAMVRELAMRAGVDTAPLERPQARDRSADLLRDFFRLCTGEMSAPGGSAARAFLERRGFDGGAVELLGLGVVPNELFTKSALTAAGYSELEIARSGVLADGRWAGRLCGAWRDERGAIRTLWARAVDDSNASARYLYLSGASRSGLPPYGLAEVLRLRATERRELVLVEGLIDVHKLRANGLTSVAAVGGARVQPEALIRLCRLGFDSVVLAFDNDEAGREGMSRAIERVTRSDKAPALRVLEPATLGDAKDPDAFVQAHGIDRFRTLVDGADCAVSWRVRELTQAVSANDQTRVRRAALAKAGKWLGTLAPRYALEQEDAIRRVADQCGYSREAVERAFRARFWGSPSRGHRQHPEGLVIER